jgi:hypothetical protein
VGGGGGISISWLLAGWKDTLEGGHVGPDVGELGEGVDGKYCVREQKQHSSQGQRHECAAHVLG